MKKFKFVTHSQAFHLDEVFALALLDIFIFKGNFELIRTRDAGTLNKYKSDSTAYVVDVGFEYNPEMLNFDHHQKGFSVDGDSKVSSCGLIWKHIKDSNLLNSVMNKETSDMIEERLISIVDAHDNGVYVNGIEKLEFILMYNRRSSGLECKKQDGQFMRAFNAAKEYYMNLFAAIRSEIKESKDAVKYYNKSKDIDGIIVTDSKIVDIAKNYNKYDDKKLVIIPHSRGKWTIRSLNVGNTADYSVRCPAPASWGGLIDNDLQKATGFDGVKMVFCHMNLFLTIVECSLDDAITIAKFIIMMDESSK